MPGYRRRGEPNPNQVVEDPSAHPGEIWDPQVADWVSEDQWGKNHQTGNGWAQLLAAAAPFIAGGIGSLAGAGGAAGASGGAGAASSAVPSIGATGGLASGAFPSIAGTSGLSAAIPSLGVTAGIPAGSTFSAPAAASSAGSTAGNSSMASKSLLGKIFNPKTGIDPTALLLGGLSAAMGGGGNGQTGAPNSFHKGVSPGAAQLVDPIQSLYNAINASNNMGVGLNNRLQQGINLRSSYIQPGPAPVRIPGLNFQIGGGMGTDPAFKDPSLLNLPFEGDLYSGAIPQQNMNPGTSPVPKRRSGQ